MRYLVAVLFYMLLYILTVGGVGWAQEQVDIDDLTSVSSQTTTPTVTFSKKFYCDIKDVKQDEKYIHVTMKTGEECVNNAERIAEALEKGKTL